MWSRDDMFLGISLCQAFEMLTQLMYQMSRPYSDEHMQVFLNYRCTRREVCQFNACHSGDSWIFASFQHSPYPIQPSSL